MTTLVKAKAVIKKSTCILLSFLMALLMCISFFIVISSTSAGAVATAVSSQDFGYSGNVQAYTVPASGYYQLETWGASGGSTNGQVGGYGGYSTGVAYLEAGQALYICVGGAGEGTDVSSSGITFAGGYNGGGGVAGNAGANHTYGSGGGATHIATASGLLKDRAEDYTSTVLIVSGGGGGARWQQNYAQGQYGHGGHGGGYLGQNALYYGASVPNTVVGGSQTTAGSGGFGYAGTASATGAGGGGLYGGGAGGSGSGGSGYLNPSLLSYGGVTKHMSVFDNTATNYASSADDIRTIETTLVNSSAVADAAKAGAGYARISFLSAKTTSFGYTGTVQAYTVNASGYYQLETWGASGGSTNGQIGGYGGYSTGVANLEAGQVLYICVGGAGEGTNVSSSGITFAGGYNGGGGVAATGGANHTYGSGGGATHIATASGLLSERATDYTSTVLIVSGGGGGARWQENYAQGQYGHGGHGGGYRGQNASFYWASVLNTGAGGSQTSAGSGGFGYAATVERTGAGGGGLYGGSSGGSGSGGSGYLNPTLVSYGGITKHMVIFDNTATDYSSPEDNTRTFETTAVNATAYSDNAKTGSGFAKITQLDIQPENKFTYTGNTQVFTAQWAGFYRLETWGAQGGSTADQVGGYGGYSSGVAYLDAGESVYIYVGGAGEGTNVSSSGITFAGGYNGGGGVTGNTGENHTYGSGGGATHIALSQGLLRERVADYTSTVLIVAGGGGGARWQTNFADGQYGHGGHGGGYLGQNALYYYGGIANSGFGGTQTAAGGNGGFGFGETIVARGAGGGGLYGGSAGGSGSGGSGYLNPSLVSLGSVKHMAIFDNTATDYSSQDAATKTVEVTAVNANAVADNAKTGAGYAKITPVISITLDNNGGTGVDGIAAIYNDAVYDADGTVINSVSVPTKTGYTFTGYSNGSGSSVIDASGNITDFSALILPVEGVTLTAHWAPNDYTVTYNAGSGTGEDVVVNAVYDTEFTAADGSAFTKTGYTFIGWLSSDGETTYTAGQQLVNLTSESAGNVTLTAQWAPIPYAITFYDYNGDILQSDEFNYDSVPVYDEANGIPSKPSDVQYDYTWNGWTPSVSEVTGEASYTPTFASTLRKYTVKFLDGDGNVIQESKWEYGTVPAYDALTNGTPAKSPTVQYNYTWNNGWTEEISAVGGDAEYTADFDSALNKYTVSFYDYNADLLQSGLWEYGTTPVYDENANGTPVRAYDDDYHYVFEDEWDTAIAEVTGDAEYTAVLTPVAHNYTNYVYNNDRTCDIDGTHTGECVCGKTHTELDPEYPSFGGVHLFIEYVYNDDATCLENGTETAYCERCSIATDTREKADTALGHEFLETAYVSDGDATCLVDGHETAKCSRCDVTNTRIDVYSALGHDFVEYTDNNNETCTLNATETGHCSRCDATNTREIEGSALGHDYVVTVIEPSCTNRGLTKHICSRCDDMYCDSYVDALGHDFGDWHVTVVPTCQTLGEQQRECSRCGETESYPFKGQHTPSDSDPTVCAFCGIKIPTGGTGGGTGGSTTETQVYCCESHNYPNTFWGRILAFICRIKQLFLGLSSVKIG